MNKNNSTLTINTTNNSADKSNKKTADNTANLLVDRYKTRPCKNYTAQGFCPYEERCMFAHGKDELRTREMNIADGLNTDEAIKFHQRELRYRRQVQERLAAVAQLHPATAVPLAARPQLPAPLLQPSLNTNSKTAETVVSPFMKTTSRTGGHCPATTTTGVAALLFPPTPSTSTTAAVITPLGATSYSTASSAGGGLFFDNKGGKQPQPQPIVEDEKKEKETTTIVKEASSPSAVASKEEEEEVSTPSFSYYAPLPFEGVEEMMSQNSPSSTSCTCDECWQQRKQQQQHRQPGEQQQQQSTREEEDSPLLSVSGEEEEEEKQTAVLSYRYQHNPYVPYTCTTASALAAETPSQAVVVQPCGNCDAFCCRNYEATVYQLQMSGRSGYISYIRCRSPFHRQLKEEEETPLVRSAEAP